MDLKYCKILENQKTKKATFFLFGVIGQDINGDRFAQELRFIAETEQIKDITILINTPGGNVFQGFSIIGAFDFLRNLGVKFTLKNVGIAYSMGGVLLSSGENRISVNYGTVMIHDPSFSDERKSKLSESEKELIEKMGDSLATLISNGSGKDKKEIRKLMSKEKTFSSQESLEFGLIDSIEQTGKTIDQSLDNNLKMVACADLYNNSNQKKETMYKMVNEFLGLNTEANETATLNAIKVIKDQLTAKETKVNELENDLTLSNSKLDVLKNENDSIKNEMVREKATKLIENAVKEGKIQKVGYEKWIENAIKDFAGTEELIKGLSGTPGKINAQLGDNGGGDSKRTLAAKYDKLLEDPQAMDEMNPEELKVLENAFNEMNKADVSSMN